MDYNILCNFNPPSFVVISDNVPSLVYYSHFPILIISLIIGIYIFVKNHRRLENILFLVVMVVFSIWVLLDSIFWASNSGDTIMAVWSVQILVEPLVHACAAYLFYVLINKDDLPFKHKLIFFIVYIPLILIAPSKYLLSSFNTSSCLSTETLYSYYSYIIEIFYTSYLVYFAIRSYKSSKTKEKRIEIMSLSFGIFVLLVAFSWGAIIGSFTDNWSLAQYGLFGMPIFISLILKSIISNNLFDLKEASKNMLVIIFWILIASLLTITDMHVSRVVIFITLLISIAIGLVLINTSKKEKQDMINISKLANELELYNSSLNQKVTEQTLEIQQAYHLEKKSRRELEKLVEAKDNFINIIQHNLRVPITRITNELSRLPSSRNVTDTNDVTSQINHLKRVADDLKDISKIKLGSQILNLSTSSVLSLVIEVIRELDIDIKKSNISISYPTDTSYWPELRIDQNKIREVMFVVIENAIRYNTQNGTISISTRSDEDYFIMEIKNTGIGISSGDISNLFDRTFYRSSRAKEINPTGMGIGLYVSRSVIEAHHGSLDIYSGEDELVTVRISIPQDFLRPSNK